MNINQNNINLLLNNYISFVDDTSMQYNYDNNIKHLLYIIVPAFITKYGIGNEPLILKCFKNIKIIIEKHDKNVSATFIRNLVKEDNEYKTIKYITTDPFTTSTLSKILDNIIHEFNHAINSINNEIEVDDEYIKVRTGLTYIVYNKNDLSFVKEEDETVLEELLNTKDTEDILNIIKSFNDYKIDNEEISNIIYTVSRGIGNINYESDAYYVQKQICFNLMNNKTFIPTVNKLRFTGNVSDISKLFDDVINRPNSYKRLNELLTKIHNLIIKYDNSKTLKNKYLNNIKELVNEVATLIKEYELKCIFR